MCIIFTHASANHNHGIQSQHWRFSLLYVAHFKSITIIAAYQYIAVGSETGTLHIVEVPRSLIKPQQDEQVIAQAYFDRERERTEYYMSRWKYHAEQQEVASQNKMVAELQQDKQAEEQEQEIDLQALKAQFLEKIKQKSLEIDIAA